MLETKNNNIRVNLICLILVLLIIGGLWFPALMFVAFIVNALAVIILNSKESFYILLFIMPFGLIYKYPGFTLSFLTLIEIIMVFVILSRDSEIKTALLYPLTIITLYFVLRMGSYYMAIPKLVISYLLVAVFIKSYDKEEFNKYINCFILGIIVSSILGLFKESIPSLLAYYDDMNYDYIGGIRTLRFSGLFNDPNYFSIALITAMVMLIFANKYRKYPTAWFYLFFITLSIMGLFTYSKSFILVYICVVGLEVFLSLKEKRTVQSFCEIVLLAILLAVAIFGKIDLINKILSRFTNRELTTGRSDIWDNYWAVINSKEIYKWFGLGLDAPYVAEKASHSLYVEMIYYSGFIGLIFFLFSWLILVFFGHKNKIKLRNIILFVVVFGMYAFLCGFLNYAFPFYMIFCWMLADISFKEDVNEIITKD